MSKYDLTDNEDLHLRLSIMLPNRRSLYEYFCELPLEVLQAYPKKGCRWWFGRAARSTKALAIRDYILYWRYVARDFRQQYPREYLERLHNNNLRLFLRTYLTKSPVWPYEEPVRDVLQILSARSELFP